MHKLTEVAGKVAPGWEPVADAFRANFEQHRELGAACCIYHDNRVVVDLWGGVADRRTGRPWERDTVATVFSTTKGSTAICAHMLAERSQLDLDALVTRYWPEYGQNGKESTRVSWLLSHQAGVPAIDAELTLEEICAWEPVIRALEAQQPFWPPGEQHAYHTQTYGFLVGEVVRRATGKTLGTVFAEQIAVPLALDSWIGTPEHVELRIAHLVEESPPEDSQAAFASLLERFGESEGAARAAAAAMQAISDDPHSVASRSQNLGGAFPDGFAPEDGGHNARIVRAAELPATNMVTDARSLARMYAASIGAIHGVRLLRAETVEAMCVVPTTNSKPYGLPPELEAFSKMWSFALGPMRPSRLTPLIGPRSFGHPGAGGSLGFADPDARIGFGYVMNRMSYDIDDRRAASLIEAAAACLS
jgi:CubicO group peptidase (beta-lactamase class C family)